MLKYVHSAVAASLLGVSTSTLRQYVTTHGLGFIKTPAPETKDAIYARVSSKKQEDDLERQIASIQEVYPGYLVYCDICS